MIEETNGNNTINVKVSPNSVIPIASSASNDDLSLESASEYTDADESMSAPTEYLAEVSVQSTNGRWFDRNVVRFYLSHIKTINI